MSGMVPEDVFELTGVADPRLSPDGKTVAYVVGAVDAKANDYRGAIWLAPSRSSFAPLDLHVDLDESRLSRDRAASPTRAR